MRADNGRLKTESGIRPPAYSVKITGDNEAEITLVENVVEKANAEDEEEQDTTYVYDSYTVLLPYREGIESDVSANLDKWICFAKEKDYELESEKVRAERNALLADTDKDMAFDRLDIHIPEKITTATLLSAVKAFFEALSAIFGSDMAKYRQALRDIPTQKEFPYNVKFPPKP